MQHPNITTARREMMRFSQYCTPAMSVYWGQRWRDALEKDPEYGSQVIRLVEEMNELVSQRKVEKVR